jgi:hypothetical protein
MLIYATVYPKAGFTAWVTISIIWLFVGLAMVGIYPAWEARKGLKKVCAGRALDFAGVFYLLSDQVAVGIVSDITGKRKS